MMGKKEKGEGLERRANKFKEKIYSQIQNKEAN